MHRLGNFGFKRFWLVAPVVRSLTMNVLMETGRKAEYLNLNPFALHKGVWRFQGCGHWQDMEA